MKRIIAVLVSLLMMTGISFAVLFDDFQDGDTTNNPTWNVMVDQGEGMVASDPVRSGNLAWKAYGTEAGHRVLGTNVSGIPWYSFDISLEYKASTSANYHGSWELQSDGASKGFDFGLWYDTQKSPAYQNYAAFYIEEYGFNWQTEGDYILIPIGNIPRDEWLNLHSWYDIDSGLIISEVRILETNALLGQVSMEPVLNMFQAGQIDLLSIGIEETNWQYMDNITLTPEPTTLSLLAIGAFALLRRKRA